VVETPAALLSLVRGGTIVKVRLTNKAGPDEQVLKHCFLLIGVFSQHLNDGSAVSINDPPSFSELIHT
jgi:hypothetical protein